MSYKIAILITTFLRDKLLYKTLQTIVDFYPNESIVLIADQGYNDEEKNINLDYIKSQIPCEYYRLPFDCGLAYARNYLIQKAHEQQIPYVLMLADSIRFIASYRFEPIMQFLELEDNRALVGFDLAGSKCPWEFLMEVTPKGIKMYRSTKHTFFGNIKLTQIDICRNVFFAKTAAILNLYDNDMKLCEHELAFLELKKRNYKAYCTDAYVFERVNNSNTKEYETYRRRFQDYRKLFQEKLDISGWVILPKDKL
jgi:glycosyltransferase involved in cell wall biosynthesis